MRTIKEVARDIKREWTKVSPYAVEYLNAMMHLETKNDNYYYDSAESVVLYFLANAQGFRGARAKELKAELKEIIK